MKKHLAALLPIWAVLTAVIACNSCLNRHGQCYSLYEAVRCSGINENEIKKVLAHYNVNPGDSLKLRAACFLIANMPYHKFRTGLNKFGTAFDSIAKVPRSDKRRGVFEALLDSIARIHSNDIISEHADIEALDSDFIIENIELAFEAWHKHPENKRAGFETFCSYILPYRCNDEPVEPGTRKKFMEEYSWVFDSLDAGMPLKEVADKIINEFDYQNLTSIRSKYPLALSISFYKKSRIGLCDDMVNYFVHLFRALGIASSYDYIEHWGNHHSSGHSWLRLWHGDEVYCEGELLEVYPYESIPKVWRRTFAPDKSGNRGLHFRIDVTGEYKETTDVNIDIVLNSRDRRKIPVLCVFDVNMEWVQVAEGKTKGDRLHFDRIGTNVAYLPAYYSSDRLYPVNYPFFIDNDKKLHIYKPSETLLDSVILLRKAGFVTPRHRRKKQWVDSLNNGLFQGADEPVFKNAVTLATIRGFNSTQPRSLTIEGSKPFRYLRFINEHESYFGLLEFLDKNGNKLLGRILEDNSINAFWRDSALVGVRLSENIDRKDYTLGIELDRSAVVSKIRFQARNDGNHIYLDDAYELFYWDKEWKSLGQKTASDTLIVFRNVPDNALLWLRNKTKGVEENVFTMNEDGNQHWLGFCK